MNVQYHSYSNISNNVVEFCEERLDPAAVNKIIKEGKEVGLSNTDELNIQLKSSNYIPVLKE